MRFQIVLILFLCVVEAARGVEKTGFVQGNFEASPELILALNQELSGGRLAAEIGGIKGKQASFAVADIGPGALEVHAVLPGGMTMDEEERVLARAVAYVEFRAIGHSSSYAKAAVGRHAGPPVTARDKIAVQYPHVLPDRLVPFDLSYFPTERWNICSAPQRAWLLLENGSAWVYQIPANGKGPTSVFEERYDPLEVDPQLASLLKPVAQRAEMYSICRSLRAGKSDHLDFTYVISLQKIFRSIGLKFKTPMELKPLSDF